jgi:hypothetical protein
MIQLQDGAQEPSNFKLRDFDSVPFPFLCPEIPLSPLLRFRKFQLISIKIFDILGASKSEVDENATK